MVRLWLWIRMGLCTCLGLAVIGLAAVSSVPGLGFGAPFDPTADRDPSLL
jgi:hypothetical protein